MIRLIHGDCLVEMDKLIAEGVKVNAIITDPPYGVTSCKWDSVIPFDEMWLRLNKLIKDNGVIALFGNEPFASYLRISNIKNYRYDWIWNKVKPSNFQLMNYQCGKIHELILIFSKGKSCYTSNNNTMIYYPQKTFRKNIRISNIKNENYINNTMLRGTFKVKDTYKIYNDKHPISIITYSNADNKNKIHPTQKPVELLEYLIKTYTLKGETVLDFTAGSGSTGIACRNLDRNFIGIELDEHYFNIMKNRVENHKRKLF